LDVERRVKRDIRRYRLKKGERVAVALSGGKDSSVMAAILDKIWGGRLEFVGLTVDEGIEGYRPRTIEMAREITRRLGWSLVVESFRSNFGATLDSLLSGDGGRACSVCGVLRKYLLNRTARNLGASWLAVGHNLDDTAQTILMNHLRGIPPTKPQPLPGMVPRIKPLAHIPEREVALYALTQGIPMSLDECPYSSTALRNQVRDFLNSYENRHPGTKYALLRGFEKTCQNPPRDEVMGRCRVCGEPTRASTCKACQLLGKT